MRKILAIATVSAGLWTAAAGDTRWAADAHTAPRVGIFLDFDSDPPKSTLQLMEREVGAVLAATGAEFSWLTLKSDPHAETFDNLAVLRFRGSCRMERIGLAPAIDARPVTLGETDLISGGI